MCASSGVRLHAWVCADHVLTAPGAGTTLAGDFLDAWPSRLLCSFEGIEEPMSPGCCEQLISACFVALGRTLCLPGKQSILGNQYSIIFLKSAFLFFKLLLFSPHPPVWFTFLVF